MMLNSNQTESQNYYSLLEEALQALERKKNLVVKGAMQVSPEEDKLV